MLTKRAFVALMVITIITAFCFVAWSEPNPKQPIPQGKSTKWTKQQRTEQITPPPDFITTKQLIDAISHAIEATTDKAKAAQNFPPPDNSLYWFSCFLTIFTGLLVLVGAGQCYIIFKTLKETQKSANAAKDSADAIHILERANISSQIIVADWIIDIDGATFNAVLHVKNYGRTPAIIIKIAFKGIESKDIPTIDSLSEPHYPLISFIGSGEEIDAGRWEFRIPVDEWGGSCNH